MYGNITPIHLIRRRNVVDIDWSPDALSDTRKSSDARLQKTTSIFEDLQVGKTVVCLENAWSVCSMRARPGLENLKP